MNLQALQNQFNSDLGVLDKLELEKKYFGKNSEISKAKICQTQKDWDAQKN
jgi:hypothetical protein